VSGVERWRQQRPAVLGEPDGARLGTSDAVGEAGSGLLGPEEVDVVVDHRRRVVAWWGPVRLAGPLRLSG
jgi:hypothetical protein